MSDNRYSVKSTAPRVCMPVAAVPLPLPLSLDLTESWPTEVVDPTGRATRLTATSRTTGPAPATVWLLLVFFSRCCPPLSLGFGDPGACRWAHLSFDFLRIRTACCRLFS